MYERLPLYISQCMQEKKYCKMFTKFTKFSIGILSIFLVPYRNFWTLGAGVGRWTLDVVLWAVDSGCWTQDSGLWTLDSGLWTLGSGLWTLDSRRWTLDSGLWTVAQGQCCWLLQNKSEPSFLSCLIKLLKILSMRISKDHGHAYFVEPIGCDMSSFRNSVLTLSVTL